MLKQPLRRPVMEDGGVDILENIAAYKNTYTAFIILALYHLLCYTKNRYKRNAKYKTNGNHWKRSPKIYAEKIEGKV